MDSYMIKVQYRMCDGMCDVVCLFVFSTSLLALRKKSLAMVLNNTSPSVVPPCGVLRVTMNNKQSNNAARVWKVMTMAIRMG